MNIYDAASGNTGTLQAWGIKLYYETPVEVKLDNSSLPNDYKLFQNYPNPFNPITKISWQSPVGSWQSLKVYDVLGNEVVKLVDEYKPAGDTMKLSSRWQCTTGSWQAEFICTGCKLEILLRQERCCC